MRRNWAPRRQGPKGEAAWIDPDLDDFDEFFPEDDAVSPRPHPSVGPPPSPAPPPASWQQRLSTLNRALQTPPADQPWPLGRQILYVVDVAGTMEGVGLTLEVASRQRKRDGSWSRERPIRIRGGQIATLPDEADRRILALLRGPIDSSGIYGSYYSSYSASKTTTRSR